MEIKLSSVRIINDGLVTSVWINDVDVSKQIRSVKFEHRGGEVPICTIEYLVGTAQACGCAAIKNAPIVGQ